jgi:hypothetical protein
MENLSVAMDKKEIIPQVRPPQPAAQKIQTTVHPDLVVLAKENQVTVVITKIAEVVVTVEIATIMAIAVKASQVMTPAITAVKAVVTEEVTAIAAAVATMVAVVAVVEITAAGMIIATRLQTKALVKILTAQDGPGQRGMIQNPEAVTMVATGRKVMTTEIYSSWYVMTMAP